MGALSSGYGWPAGLVLPDGGDLADGQPQGGCELCVGAAAVRGVDGGVCEREARELEGALVGVGARQLFVEYVAGEERHERDDAFGGVSVGQSLDVCSEPVPVAAGEPDGAVVVGEGDGLHTVLSAWRRDFAPGALGAVVLVELAQEALGAGDLAVDDAVADVFGGGDLVVAVADHEAQQEAAGALGQLAHEVEPVA